jgi:hypothetical protein
LDEHIGVDGLPGGNPDTPRLRQVIRAFYLKRGFQLFGGAYSQHFNTQVSIPFVLNFGQAAPSGPRYPAKGNAYFSLLKRSGYRINVLQSMFIDYCSDLVDLCTTYHSQSYAPVPSSPLSAGDKAILIERKMVPTKVVQAVWRAYLWLKDVGFDLPAVPPITELHTTPMNGLAAIRRLQRDLTNLQPGQFYFAHILLPHKPYALRSDCSVVPISHWRQGLRGQPLIERQNAYAEQMLCTSRELAAVLTSVDRSPAHGNTIVIVHGDHGSRISDFDPTAGNIGKFGDDALVAGFSTLFAVRGPGIKAGYDNRHYSLAELLHELAASGFRKTGSHPIVNPSVFIADNNGVVRRRVALPKAW